MEININQKKISFGDEYQIFKDGQQTHFASQRIFRIRPEINLFDNNGGRARMTISKRFSWFKAKYDITTWDNNVLQFRTPSFWRLHHQCQYGSDCYDIYGHRKRKYSIFKNNVQVAWWDKEALTFFEGDNYKIVANQDCDVDLIIAFCLIVDNFSSDDHDGNTVTYDFGNVAFEEKRFNRNWKPKY